MKLLLKFNLVFLLIFAIGLAAAGRISWTLLERNAREEIAGSARLLMDAALAARWYTSTQVGPLLETQMKYTFLPQSVPAYSATEVFNDLRKKHDVAVVRFDAETSRVVSFNKFWARKEGKLSSFVMVLNWEIVILVGHLFAACTLISFV